MASEKIIGKIYTDTIDEKTSAAGVTIDSVKLKDGEAYNSSNIQLANIQNVQDSAADKANYWFDGVGDYSINADAQTLGTSPLTILTMFNVNRSSASANQTLIRLGAAIGAESSHNNLLVKIETNDKICINYFGSGVSNAESTQAVTVNKWHTVAALFNGSQLQTYLDGIAGTQVSYSAGNLSNNKIYIGKYSTSASLFQGLINRTVVFNYALSADKIARYSAGAKLDYEDVGGSMIPLNSVTADQDFSSDTGYWTKAGTVAITGGQCLFNNTSATIAGLTRLNALTVGKIYKIQFTVSGYGSGGIYPYINDYEVTYVSKDGVSQALSQEANSNGTWIYYVRAKGTPLYIQVGASTTYLFIDNLTINPLGAVLDLEPENITDTTWFDASPNGLHGTVTGAIANRFVPSYSSKNYVINGAMDFWQRGTSIAVTPSSSYTADRFYVALGAGNQTVSQITGDSPGNSLYVLQHSRTASSSASNLRHRIESINATNLKNKQVTLSFWIKRTAGVLPLIVRISTPTAVDNYTSTTTIKEWEITNISSSWQLMSFSTTLPASATNGVEISWYSITDSNGFTFRLADVMLNEGSVAAPFERAGGSIAGELALCQRYYEKSYKQGIVPGTTTQDGYDQSLGGVSTSSLKTAIATFKVTKRITLPSITVYDYVGNANKISTLAFDGALTNNVTPGTTNKSDRMIEQQVTTANTGLLFHWTADAEI